MFSLILTLNFTVTLLLTATLKYLEYHQINLLKWYLLGSFLALAAYHLHCSLKYYNKKLICNF